ncbi:connector enhancer of kinase suppressor of ras 1 isoform X1 [Cuculus canorus]|uniref:connector enhancer of kinase suppressor of ras 1 isoform X1 n=1 Tax=Cuculus canorus TaxID=55661 RepID=UPI0023AA2F8F|nr:connector enhancer of kinase suppressor of ras 1 isoform X1 [Cuculus canorus]
MEPVGAWGPARAAAWLRGLDAAVQGYPFESWGLAGPELLRLSVGTLEALGVRCLGHQELLLEAVEQLRALDAELASTSLRTLTERLRELAQGIQSLVLGGPPAGVTPSPPPLTLLARVIDLIGAAKGLFLWLNRYLFSTLNDFSASRDIVLLCTQLAETLQADSPAAERDGRILRICQHIVGICESIVSCSPAALLDRRAVLQRVGLALPPSPWGNPSMSPDTPTLPSSPWGSLSMALDTTTLPARQRGSPTMSLDTITLAPNPRGSPPMSSNTSTMASSPQRTPPTSPDTPTLPSDLMWSSLPLLTTPLGFEITSTSSCLHFVSATSSEALAAHGGRILPGDEIVQVNEQVVVGWTRINLAKKLLEKRSKVTLVLKNIPLDPSSSPPSPTQQGTLMGCGLALTLHQQLTGAFSDATDPPSTRSSECPGSPVSLTSSTAADLDSGPDSALDLITDEEDREDERDSRLPRAAEGLSGCGAVEEAAAWEGGTPCSPGTPTAAGPCPVELSPPTAPVTGTGDTEPGHLPAEGSPQTGRRQKGVATRLSRRRVSCRDLGRVDCDGWLLKKKDHVGFMAQKWKRCWFVLKGHTLYWYHHPNDEKAAGLINVATYDLESTREQKKKYVFQLSHQRYKPFIFAAETLADLSMWVSHLITAKTKYTLAHQSVPDKEEDCYSETEAEDPDEESPRQGCDLPKKRPPNALEKAQLFSAGGEPSSAAGSPQGSPRPCSPMDPTGEDLECLMQCLKQGGVSLIGQQRFLTQEQYRKSFIRRNKNPHINEKVHAVRALQSTLKAKLVELQALEQLLSDAALTSEKFRHWKEEHQELYQELRELWARQQGQDADGGLGAEHGSPEGAAEP